jgi:RHS repeat-associated protein
LPTGGTITYTYSGGNNGINCIDGSTATLTRATPDGTWTYAQVKGSGAASTTTVTDPQGNVTTIQFQGIYETQRVVRQGSGTVLSTTNTCYNAAAPPEPACTGTAVSLPITQRYVSTQLGGGNLTDLHYQKYDNYGNPLEQDDYDYGSGANGGLLKKTVITYASLVNITAFRQQVTVTNGSGATVSQTNYNYDQGTVAATSGTPQHTSISGSRGNLTSANYYTSGSTVLTKSYTYFDTGKVQTATDVNGAATTYVYPDPNSTCGNAFPTSVNEPLSLSGSFTWNCTGGVQTSVHDENGQPTTVTYNDPYFWRPNAVTDPLSDQTSITYQPNPSYCCPWMVATAMTFNNNNSVVEDVQYKDGLGRTYVDQHWQGPGSSSLDSVSYTFDSNGRPYSVSMPCVISWAQTCSTPKTTQTYDALNRPLVTTDGGGGTVSYSYTNNDVFITIGPAPSGENTKRRQLEYDALGRLTSVCEISSLPGSGTCGQNSPQTGYWTKYTYNALGQITGVTQNAQSSSTQTRTYVYDLIGRLTSETNPESGSTSYAYDAPTSNCNNSSWNANDPGQLVQTQDANGNVTCYYHDALGRIGTYFAVAGPGQGANSGCRHFFYDNSSGLLGSRPSGVTVNNGLGRLIAATTDNCAWPPSQSEIVTDKWFSYTARGEVSDLWESTPHSGGYYHTGATYWADGALASVGGLSGIPTFTTTVEGEGRISGVNASYGQNPVVNSTYNTAGQVATVTLGTGDYDRFTYDLNAGRMTQYAANINGAWVAYGNLTWNPNGTLSQLQTVDVNNSADNQTCNYAHDDVARLASTNCGSAWSQTFTYDPLGNITKSGSISWNPGYNSATNRYQLGGTQYDNNGNLTKDTFHTYTWSAYNQAASIDATQLTYDAQGQVVETNNTGTITDIVYTPWGRRFGYYVDGSFAGFSLDLPGGLRAGGQTLGLGVQFYSHPDWLRSQRTFSSISRTWVGSQAYAPFGETYAKAGSPESLFTNQPNDEAPDLFDFLAREQHGIQGRWISPDPAGLAAVDPTNPQSWNRYAYVLNNPLAYVDPSGLNDCPDMKSTCGDDPGIDSGAPGVDLFGDPVAVDPLQGCCVDPLPFIDLPNLLQFGPTVSITVWAPIPPDTMNLGDMLNGSWGSNGPLHAGGNSSSIWSFFKVPWSGSVVVPLVPFGPAASAGAGPTFAYNPITDTGCAGLAAGAMVPAGGRAAAVGPLTVGNLGNVDNILAGGSVFAGAQSPNPAVGVQVLGNTSGLLAGPTFGTLGIVAGVSVSGCKSGIGKELLNWFIDTVF